MKIKEDILLKLIKMILKNVTKILKDNSVHYDELGMVNEGDLIINDKTKVSIDELITSNTNWLTDYMSK